jgi:hypothetical protein
MVAHGSQQVHIFSYLLGVLGFRVTELEIYNHPICAVGHHTVWATLLYFSVGKREDGTLVEECPTM